MLEITIEPRRTRNLKQAVTDAVESGDYDSLFDDVRDCFTEEQAELIEEVLESGDIGEAIEEVLAEWGGDDVDELIETMESFFNEASVELHFSPADLAEVEEEEEDVEVDEYDEEYEDEEDEEDEDVDADADEEEEEEVGDEEDEDY